MLKTKEKVQIIIQKTLEGERLSLDDALLLYTEGDFLETGNLANNIRKNIHPDTGPVTFVIDRNINYTNVCCCKCKFCAFHREPNDSDAYVLDYSIIKTKLEELTQLNGTQLLLQGGLNPHLKYKYYLNLLENIRRDFPDLTIHAFSPPEISFIADIAGLTLQQVLKDFTRAGLSSLPGGGAEILSDSIRENISPNKIDSSRWLEVMEIAHNMNIPSTATLMAGTIEQPSDIIRHLFLIRNLQDKTNGFTAFIPWSFQSNRTKIIPKQLFTGMDYLKLVAISRIVLDNIINIQVSWPTQGIKMAQIALEFGANDFGSTMLEENVISSTGYQIKSSVDQVINAIKAIKRKPAQRTTGYKIIQYY